MIYEIPMLYVYRIQSSAKPLPTQKKPTFLIEKNEVCTHLIYIVFGAKMHSSRYFTVPTGIAVI